jgi:S-layer protein (TIGR01567 family)
LNKCLIISLFLSCIFYNTGLSPANEVNSLEIRGTVATGDFEWNSQNFAGFYYDIDNNLGTEKIVTTITEGNKLQEPTGIIYTATAQKNGFAFDRWGYYNVIGFLGKSYFTGYIDDGLVGTTSEILEAANVANLLGFGKLAEVLIDEGDEKVIDLGKSIDLKEGYALKPTVGTDNKGLLVELLKNEKVIDRKAVLLPGTYVYTAKVGDAEGMPLIAAHFQEPIFLDSKSYCKVDGLWQISENTTNVEVDTKYDKMRIASVDSTSGIITMDNTDDTVTLSKNLEISLLGDIRIKTADQDYIDADNPLRYYIFKSAEIAAGEGRL